MRSPKDTVMAAFNAFRSRDAGQIAAAFTFDATWTAPVGNATAAAIGHPGGVLDLAAIIKFMTKDYGRLFGDVSVEVTRMIAEGETVMVEQRFRATVANGRHYDNAYCFVFEVEGERVKAMREYMDTLGGQSMIFGNADPARIV